ncbi:MAG: energy-coupling factor ABC transporter ATP-binding protein [Treponema sp.]|jgi:cobalt/nickel transport system ATP-binding protein|nr:energy-coupling factor ABC transporter ATP-binding protein [Treponema sp.]
MSNTIPDAVSSNSGRRILVTARNMDVRYQGENKNVLDKISFVLYENEKTALVGPNGAGKSTLLLTLAGVLPFTGVLDGAAQKNRRHQCGLVMQNPDDQLFMPTVAEDIAFGPRNYKMPEDIIAAKMEKTLAALAITHLKDRLTSRLSGGEKRLVALAGILIMETPLILFDEPGSFLDPKGRRLLLETLRSRPEAMLVATHDLDLARSLCDRVILLREGKIYADGKTALLDDGALIAGCGL